MAEFFLFNVKSGSGFLWLVGGGYAAPNQPQILILFPFPGNPKAAPVCPGRLLLSVIRWILEDGNRCGLQALRAFLNREFDLLSLFQIPETIRLDGGIVDEDVWAAFTGDKAIALGGVEPFDCAGDAFVHFDLLLT